MLYRKLTIVCEGAEERLNRVLQVRSDIDIMTLGYIILDSLCAEFDFPYTIEDDETCYVPDDVLFNNQIDIGETKMLSSLKDTPISKLPDSFCLKYFDSPSKKNCWKFNCTFGKGTAKRASDAYACMLDGKGMGLWEEEKDAYFNYLNGMIDPELDCDTEDAWVPDNLDIETYGETDSAFDLETAKEDFEDDMDPEYAKTEIEYILHRSEYLDEDDDDWDDDFDDYDDPFDLMDNEELLTKSAMSLGLMTVMSHIENLDFVADKYNELVESYAPEEAIGMILNVIVDYLEDFISGDLLQNNKEYRKKIKNLK